MCLPSLHDPRIIQNTHEFEHVINLATTKIYMGLQFYSSEPIFRFIQCLKYLHHVIMWREG